MTIYLQEIAVATAAQKMPEAARQKVEDLNSFFPEVLDSALYFLDWQIPCKAWFLLFKSQATGA